MNTLKRAHLLGFVQHGVNSHATGMWRNQTDKIGYNFSRPAYWQYMELCYKLWDSWEPGAVIADKASGVYADPAKVKVIDHHGKYFKCKGRHFCQPSPQGKPVLWQAGSSGRGRDFAAKHAEAIFAV